MRPLKLVLRIALPLGMSALFVWLSLRKTDLAAVGRSIASADPLRMLAYLAILLMVHVVRTVRWGILLEPLGHVSFRRVNSATAVGFMLLVLLPLRLGEFARPLLIARPPPGAGAPLRRSGAFASIVVERIVDGLAIGLLGILALRKLGSGASGQYLAFARHASVVVAAGFFALCVAMTLAFFFRERALQVAERVLRPISDRLAGQAMSMLDAFIGALHLGSGFKALGFFALTFIYWGLSGAGLAVLAPAFGFAFTPLMVASILAVQVVGVMVPAGPGMVGTLQFFTQVGLSLFVAGAFSDPAVASRAAGYANAVWMLQFATQTGLGLVFMHFGHVSLKGLLGPSAISGETERELGAAAAP